MKQSTRCAVIVLVTGLNACATYPTGPSMLALPGTGSNFEQFQIDDSHCQMYAQHASGNSAQQSAQRGAVDSAAAGTAIGAAAGALIGAASGDPAAGAAIGAGSGLLLGSMTGIDTYGVSGSRVQDRYDNAYIQCMYGRGHQVPVPASVAAANRAQPAPAYVAPPRGSAAPSATSIYPPPNTPPPPGY